MLNAHSAQRRAADGGPINRELADLWQPEYFVRPSLSLCHMNLLLPNSYNAGDGLRVRVKGAWKHSETAARWRLRSPSKRMDLDTLP